MQSFRVRTPIPSSMPQWVLEEELWCTNINRTRDEWYTLGTRPFVCQVDEDSIHTWNQVRYCFFYAILIRSSERLPVHSFISDINGWIVVERRE